MSILFAAAPRDFDSPPASTTPVDDLTLVKLAQGGNSQAFAELVGRHGPMVYNLALRLLNNPHEAEDMAQETFVRAWQALPGFRGQAAFSTWLYRIATNLCYNRLPQLRASLQALDASAAYDLSDNGPLPETLLQSAEARRELFAAVDALPRHYRLLIQLRHMQGLGYQEIAEVTGMPLGTVKTGLHRAHRRLRTALVGDTPLENNDPGTEGKVMIDQDDQLDADLHNILKEYPQAALPPRFQRAVLSRIATPGHTSKMTISAVVAPELSASSFLELSSALVMGLLLSAVLLLGLSFGFPFPEAGLFPINLTLDVQALPWGWIAAALVVVVVELVIVILAGLHLTEA